MNRQKRAIEFAKRAYIELNPDLADPEVRKYWWKHSHPIEKEMFLQMMTYLANQDLERIEELTVVEDDE